MAQIILPFSTQSKADIHDTDFFRRERTQGISSELKEVAEENQHLLEYLCLLPVSETGIPEYYSKLSRNMGDIKMVI